MRRQPTLLLVEDIRVSATLAGTMLKKDGYEVIIAKTGNQALEFYKNHHNTLELVLMDINLPDINGIEVTVRIREYEAQNAIDSCIIYALTGNAGDDNCAVYRSSGMNGCILKGTVLHDRLEDLLQQSRCNPEKFAT
jgi:CheY-like chemotaxis protein